MFWARLFAHHADQFGGEVWAIESGPSAGGKVIKVQTPPHTLPSSPYMDLHNVGHNHVDSYIWMFPQIVNMLDLHNCSQLFAIHWFLQPFQRRRVCLRWYGLWIHALDCEPSKVAGIKKLVSRFVMLPRDVFMLFPNLAAWAPAKWFVAPSNLAPVLEIVLPVARRPAFAFVSAR